jgi:Flp pilus assembly protein TadB
MEIFQNRRSITHTQTIAIVVVLIVVVTATWYYTSQKAQHLQILNWALASFLNILVGKIRPVTM